jgi:Tol biopolymer transport system component
MGPLLSVIWYAFRYLFYVEDDVLWAHPFDETSHRLIGNRHRVIYRSSFSVSHTGVLAYWTQPLIQQKAQLQWVDRKGNRLGLVGSPAVYDGFDLSRNGDRLISAQAGKDGIILLVNDLATGGSFPVKFSITGTVPVWAPNSAQFAFLHSGAGTLYLADADQSANSPIRLTDRSLNQLAQSWTAAGDQLVFVNYDPETGQDLFVFNMEDKHVRRLDWNTSFNDFGGRLAPSDRWIAYVTDQTDRNEVWVAAFPSGKPRRQISLAGGSHPCWRDDGAELYFISAEGQLIAVPFSTHGTTIDLGAPTNLFRIPGNIDTMAGSHNIYKTIDGKRFLVAFKSEDVNVPPINMILNWPKLLAEK